jgi:hypothetical protein
MSCVTDFHTINYRLGQKLFLKLPQRLGAYTFQVSIAVAFSLWA